MTGVQRAQSALKDLIKKEIGGQTWQFPIDTFIRILSPRTPKDPFKFGTSRADFKFEVDDPYFEAACVKALQGFRKVYDLNLNREGVPWKSTQSEGDFYQPFCRLLNECVTAGHNALNAHAAAPQMKARYHQNLKFTAYTREVGEPVEGAGPLKPDFFGGRQTRVSPKVDLETHGKAWWRFNHDDDANRDANIIGYPGEIKNSWPEMVQQAGTYAGAQFAAFPSKSFSLVFTYNYTSGDARVIIYHHSGLSSSESLQLNTDDGQRDLLKIVVTLLTWTSSIHDGFEPSRYAEPWILPNSGEDITGTEWTPTRIYRSLSVRGRFTHVYRLKLQSAIQAEEAAVEADKKAAERAASTRRYSPRAPATAKKQGMFFL